MRKRQFLDAVGPLLALAVLFAGWESAVVLFGVSEIMLPKPSRIFVEIVDRAPMLALHASSTVTIILSGFLLSVAVAIPLALAISFIPVVRRVVYPIVVFSQLIPKIAIAPLFIIWFGFGVLPKVLITFLISFFPILIQAIVGFTSIRPEPIRVARSMGAGPIDMFLRIRLPHALPNLFAGLKMSMAAAAIGAIVSEFIASSRGLGYLVLVANGEMNSPLAFAGMMLLSLIGIVLFFAVELIQRFATPWDIAQRRSTPN